MKKLFWEDPYLKECAAMVESINGNEVKLSQSVFFAFSGGQESDSGTIGGIPVKEARKEADGGITYVMENPPTFSVGDEVRVTIDWEKRYKIMKLHTAAHIVWFIFERKTGVKKLIGSNVTNEKSRIDYEFPESVSSILPELEGEVNELIAKGAEIKTYADAENPGRRWWELGEWKCPCGGTHLKDLKEIGALKLKRKNLGKGKERIEITLA
ncbi:MAG: alanyl-tRNA editing protein [Candidatus ainarchaeum sp.]|nr:alanyl-tRNA editing protein [Candidatus ainarchaeum sp.]MDD5096465.1 alanyl-tRNA editing protein [Candidatus ainarchaeum sp.]